MLSPLLMDRGWRVSRIEACTRDGMAAVFHFGVPIE